MFCFMPYYHDSISFILCAWSTTSTLHVNILHLSRRSYYDKFKCPMGGPLTRTYIETFITLKCMELFDVAFDPATHLICLVSAEVEEYVKRGFTCIPCTVSEAGDDNDIINRISEKTFKIAIIKRIDVTVIAPSAGRKRSSSDDIIFIIIASF